MKEKPKKNTRKKRVVKIKENDLTQSKEFIGALDKFIKAKPVKKIPLNLNNCVMSKQAEQQTEWVINNILVNNDWIIDNTPKKNVFFQKAKPEHQSKLEIFSKKKGYKKPDYILYKENTPLELLKQKEAENL